MSDEIGDILRSLSWSEQKNSGGVDKWSDRDMERNIGGRAEREALGQRSAGDRVDSGGRPEVSEKAGSPEGRVRVWV